MYYLLQEISNIQREQIRPNWQTRMLLPTWSYEGNGTAPDIVYRKILGFCKINFNHLMHLRSLAIEQASTWGLDVFHIATMSKHLIDKINRFYMSENNRDVLSKMSGFREEYDQLRTSHSYLGSFQS